MLQKKLLFLSVISIMVIAVVHIVSLRLSWYYTHPWMDIVIHILGGFWVAATALWMALRFGHIDTIVNYRRKAFFISFAAVFLVGIAWEMFELLSGNTFLHSANFATDSLSDILDNFIGCFFAFLYAIRMKRCRDGFICE